MRSLFLGLACVVLPVAAQSLSGRRAPSFSLPDSTLAQHDILDYRGRWLLLDFMKTDCPHCAAVSRNLEDIKRQFGSKVAILSVVIAPPENTNTVAKYTVQNNLTSPILFDQGQVAVAYFKVTPAAPGFDTPHLFVINPSGMLVRDWPDTDQTHDIVEGKGLARELQMLMAAPAK